MKRSNWIAISAVLLVCLSVVAVGLVAATIDSVAVTGEGMGSGGEFDPTDDSSSQGDGLDLEIQQSDGDGVSEHEQVIDLRICIEYLSSPISILGIFLGSIVVLFGIYRRYNAATSGLFATFLVPFVMFWYFFLTNCTVDNSSETAGMLTGNEVLSQSDGGLSTAPAVPPSLLAVVFGGVIVASAFALYSMTGEDETFEPVEDEDVPDDPDAADFARAAGRAADRIEEANMPVDNAVYRAWLEMTRMLDIENPDTAAPRDFAELAVEVGLAEDDVWELTELFNEVRYGGKDPENRGERALEILRTIERTYEETEQ